MVFCALESSFEECQACECNGNNKENDDEKEIENIPAENNTDDDAKEVEDILAAYETQWSTHAPDETVVLEILDNGIAFQDVQHDIETELEMQEK